MEQTLELTERQQQVLDLLRQDVGAREIGTRLGITRNAVYQTITRLKKHGVLDEDFTPDKGAQRPPGPRPSAQLIGALTAKDDPATGDATSEPAQKLEEIAPLSAELVRELARVQQELATIANRLSRYL